MNLYDQLTQLQMIPEAYHSWANYRERLTDYIIDQLKVDQDVAILGVGRSNDINLKRLLPYTKTLTLWDKDKVALKDAVKQYQLEGETKLKMIHKDLLGLQPEDYRLYADHLVVAIRQKGIATSVDDLAEVALQELRVLAEKIQPVDLGHHYDTVITIGLHSQMLSMIEWIWQIMLQTLGKEEIRVREAIIALNQPIIEAFHHQILQSTSCQIITGCELGRQGRIGSIQGAIQGLQSLENLRNQGKLKKKSKCLLEWPFDKKSGVIYEMLIQCDYIL